MNTMQQEFDAVVEHLYKQGRPAVPDKEVPDGPGCYYRTPDGTLSCAVGCRIPDAVYATAMDKSSSTIGTGVESLVERFKDVLPPEIVAYTAMFSALQVVHDGCMTNGDGSFRMDKLETRLQEVAASHGLTFNKPQ